MKRKKARVHAAVKSEHGKKVCEILDTCVQKAVERIAQKQSVASDKEIKRVAESFANAIGKAAKDSAVVWLEEASHLKVMPQGVRFWAARGDYELVVVEQSPQLRTLGFSAGFVSRYGSNSTRGIRQKGTYTVALPFVYFIIGFYKGNFNSLAVGYRAKPIKSLGDMIYQTNLPNMGGENLGICLGGFRVVGKNLAEKCNSVIQRVWCSQFTTDSADQFTTTISKIRSLEDWEKQSQKDSLFILDVPFKQGSKLQRLVNNNLPSYRSDAMSITKVWAPFHGKVAKAICERLSETATSVKFSPTLAVQRTLTKEFTELYDRVYEEARKDGIASIEQEKKLAQVAKKKFQDAEKDYREKRTTYVKKSAALSARERRVQLMEKKLAATEGTPRKMVKKKAVKKKAVKKKAVKKKVAPKKKVAKKKRVVKR